jgi:hypothetical protein
MHHGLPEVSIKVLCLPLQLPARGWEVLQAVMALQPVVDQALVPEIEIGVLAEEVRLPLRCPGRYLDWVDERIRPDGEPGETLLVQ